MRERRDQTRTPEAAGEHRLPNRGRASKDIPDEPLRDRKG